ncbi:MAG TPA: primosomal protein N' [Clostridiales bacterium]|nr:primosomal protein N' [Clostridiales bacterium]
MKRYAGVIIDQAHPSIDKIYHYSIPEDIANKIDIGFRVLVPFGPYNNRVEGYVVQFDDTTEVPIDKIKPIYKLIDTSPVLLSKHIPMIDWMVDNYHCMKIEAIRCFVPPGVRSNVGRKYKKIVCLKTKDNIDERIANIKKRSTYMAAILEYLKDIEQADMEKIASVTSAPPSSFKNLEKRGWISIEEKEVYRETWPVNTSDNIEVPSLTDEQQHAVTKILDKLNRQEATTFLLHGITGSGKTEVYLRIVAETLNKGKQAIVLVPEISLTPQTVKRFKNRFGDKVAILHSRLSEGERYDEWRKIRNGEAKIVVGARSAIFAPFSNLGVIIIDEAHEDSYKSDLRPKYHALEIAEKRCQLEGATLVLGSATPSLEQYNRALNGEFELIELNHRVEGGSLPHVEIVDMRYELLRGNRSMLSASLYNGLKSVLDRGEQAMLLLNRRGYANFISCRECGWVAQCKRCAVSLTYHADKKRLKCHYCGDQYPYPKRCPKCNSRFIKKFGVGTQRLETELSKYFPHANIIRMDMDTTSKKNAHQNILSSFGKGEYDILLGTQMIAKGLDFPNVTLVGVVAADASLNLPEYRSPERTFQLITQVAGRAGRGSKIGKVIVQTYTPDHYAIKYAAKHDYRAFYNYEIGVRRRFDYPPFVHIIKILSTGVNEDALINTVEDLERWLKKKISENLLLKKGLIHIGAYPAPISKIKDRYRWQILIKIENEESFLYAYHGLIDTMLKCYNISDENISIDFNPTSLL